MARQFKYESVFAPYFGSFLKMKDTMGYGLDKFGYIFLELDRFFLKTGATTAHISSEQIAAWRATRINDKTRTLYDKYSVLSQFCKYMCHLGHECHIPRLPKKNAWSFVPYIFTHRQMQHIFRECDRLAMPHCCNMNTAIFAIPALMRFLYSTGGKDRGGIGHQEHGRRLPEPSSRHKKNEEQDAAHSSDKPVPYGSDETIRGI